MAWMIRGDPKVVFSDPNHGREYLRLMLAWNVLDTLHRPFFETMGPDYQSRYSAPVMRGDRMVLLCLIYGALSEALDAYDVFRGPIEALAKKASPELAPMLVLLREASRKDKNDKTTFLNRIAGRVRSSIAFHWDRNTIERERAHFTARDEILLRGGPTATGGQFARFPYADGVMAKIAHVQESHDAREAAIKEANEVTNAFRAVVEAALAQHMLNSGCREVDA